MADLLTDASVINDRNVSDAVAQISGHVISRSKERSRRRCCLL